MRRRKSSNLKEDDDISCHLQKNIMGGLKCKAAQLTGKYSTRETTPEICFRCDVGKIYREIGCKEVTAKILFNESLQGIFCSSPDIFCNIRKRATTLKYCRTCNLVTAETTRKILDNTKNLYQAHNFDSAYRDLEKARKSFRDGNYENTVTGSIASFESTMKICHDKLGKQLPQKKQITGLWKSTKNILNLLDLDPSGETEQLISSLTGVMIHLGGLRNVLSDAHGKGVSSPKVSEIIAEFTLNTAATLSTFIIRRYIQIK